MAIPSYRDTVRPALIDTNIPSDGSAEAAQSLANSFKQFERAGMDILGGISAERGRREGAEAGRTGDPAFRTGMASTTVYGRAYNDSATRSYAIRSEAAADDAATRLELEAGNDPEAFKTTFGARRDAVLKEAPPEARVILAEVYDRRMAAGVSRLIEAQGLEMKNQARSDVAEGVQRATDRIGQLRASNDPAQYEQAFEEEIKQDMLIDAAVADGTLSATEGGTLKIAASRAVTKQTVSYRFKNELDNPYGDPVGFIQNLKTVNKTSNALPPEEEDKLVAGLLNDLQEHNALIAAGNRNQNTAQQLRWALGDNDATNAMIEGRLTSNKLSQMLEDDEIDPAVARTLYNELQAGNDKPDDERERFSVETTLLEHTEKEIGENARLSWKTRRELIEKRRQLSTTWRGTQQAKEGADRIDRALGIPSGGLNALLPDAVKKQRETALTAWYDQVDALPEAERQLKAIETAEKITDQVIRGRKNATLEKARKRLADVQAKRAAVGPLEDMGAEERKQYEADIARRKAEISKLEQEIK